MNDNEALLLELIDIFHTTTNDIKTSEISNEPIPEYFLILTSSALIAKKLLDKNKQNTLRILNNYTVHQLNEVKKNNIQNSSNPNEELTETTIEGMIQDRSEYIRYIISDEFDDKYNLLAKLYGHGEYYSSDFSKLNNMILNITSAVEKKISNRQFD